MVKRTRSQFKTDELAFPIRVKVKVPPGGMRELPIDTHMWLKENLASRMWSWGPAPSLVRDQTTAYFFRKIEDAERFIAAFPQLELADGVESSTYTAPGLVAGGGTG